MLLRATVRFTGLIIVLSQATQGVENNIAFELSDLTRIIKTKSDGEFQLEAFKSVNNDKILKDGKAQRYSQLLWVSLGHPRLLKTASRRFPPIYRMFHEQQEGYYTYIQTLTHEQRKLLLTTANAKYNVNVTALQIVHLVLKRFSCNIELFEKGKRFLIKGEVYNFHNHPLRMDFTAPLGSRERRLFEKRLELYKNGTISIRLMCSVESPGQRTRVNTLTITSSNNQQLGIEEKLFGPSSKSKGSIYVTRKQMSDLASELFSRLSIVEEYGIPEYEFSEAFVQEFIRQMAQKGFARVPFDDALSALSKYTLDFSGDLKPDSIRRDMGHIFKIEHTHNKSHIVVNEVEKKTSKNKDTLNVDVDASVKVPWLFSADLSVKVAKELSQEWFNGTKSLNDQIHDLNSASQDNIEWKIEGTKVVPKSITVAKINRANFVNTLRFERIRRHFSDAPFQRKFALYIHSSEISSEVFYQKKPKKKPTYQKEIQLILKMLKQLNVSAERQRKDSEKILKQLKVFEHQQRNDSGKMIQQFNISAERQRKYRQFQLKDGRVPGFEPFGPAVFLENGSCIFTPFPDQNAVVLWRSWVKSYTPTVTMLSSPIIVSTRCVLQATLHLQKGPNDKREIDAQIYLPAVKFNNNCPLPYNLNFTIHFVNFSSKIVYPPSSTVLKELGIEGIDGVTVNKPKYPKEWPEIRLFIKEL